MDELSFQDWFDYELFGKPLFVDVFILVVCFMIVYENEENRQFCLLIDLSAIWMERGNCKEDISFCLLHEVKTEKPFC